MDNKSLLKSGCFNKLLIFVRFYLTFVTFYVIIIYDFNFLNLEKVIRLNDTGYYTIRINYISCRSFR